MFEGRCAWFLNKNITDPVKADLYLPQMRSEDDQEYLNRLSRSYFERHFRIAIESFSGFLSNFTLSEDTHPSIKDAVDDIDLKGNSLEVFLRAADQRALRDEHCFILVEFPKRPKEINNALMEREYGLRPYLCLIDVRDVLNWKMSDDNRTLLQVTIRECVALQKGRFGVEEVTRYRVLTPGKYEIFEIRGQETILIEEGEVSLDKIPLVAYAVTTTDSNPFDGEPPLYDLAELNLKHYQKCSEKDEVMFKCNLPILQVNELNPDQHGEGQQPGIVLSTNTCLWNVQASFVEPSGSALSQTQSDIQKLEDSMSRRTLSFLTGNDFQKTATEVAAASAPVQANLAGMARAKASAVQRCFQFWAEFIGATEGGSIDVDDRVLQGANPESVATLLQLRSSGELSRKTFLSLLKQDKALPSDFDVDAEIATLSEERKQESATIPMEIGDFIPKGAV